MIEVVGSKLATRKPTDIDLPVDTAPEEDADDDEATARTWRAPSESEDVEIVPYQTPVALTPGNWKKNRGRVMVEDTEAESSDNEREVRKKRWAPKVRFQRFSTFQLA